MTGTKLYWIDGPWPGQLAIASRPRGGEWLADEMSAWRRAGISHIVSLLTSEEERDLNLKNEVREAESQGMTFTSFPIADRRIPTSEASVRSLVERLTSELLSGEKIVIHCRQGVGRSGLLAASILIGRSFSPGTATDQLSHIRGVAVPETVEQREWLDRFASAIVSSK